MERAVGDARTILDVGCGSNSPLRRFRRRYDRTVGVDLFVPALEASAAAGIHDEYRQLDVLRLDEEFEAGSFDAVVALDLVEHLSEEDATRLFGLMEQTASKRVIVHTPNGFIPQDEYDGNPLQVHRSGWTAETDAAARLRSPWKQRDSLPPRRRGQHALAAGAVLGRAWHA